MKKFNGLLSFLLLALTILNSSCRKEEFQSEGSTLEDTLQMGSTVANLLLRTAMNDGSGDNIIDGASCISVKLPITVIVNSVEIEVVSTEDFDTVEDVLEESDEDEDVLEIIFPATLILTDFSEVEVLDADEMQVYVDACGAENEDDDDIECVDIKYPVVVSLFNSDSGAIDKISLENDKELYELIENLANNLVVTINFPISIILNDGKEVIIADLDQLEDTIETYADDCDENDNNDFKEDCTDCTIDDISNLWSSCSEWRVDKLNRNKVNLMPIYKSFLFDFQEDGTIRAISDTDTFIGTWIASGSGNNINVIIDIPNLPDFNGTWTLKEMGNPTDNGKKKVEFSLDSDSLRFKEECK
ncbi:hypothetical protein GGR42_001811 [Saonia flava]|uniref:Uncharacterized protein n=1 Tax=Saonia flava TaxID=523696 RepID=A0A846R3F3_9FLAO|nr:hypothetical protein [Saonia flava]NJB71349.1 hypothetical protein [Saonia flava]